MQILIILFLGLVLRLVNLNQSLWLDEAAQALESKNSISWLWQWMSADFHPPLYHFIIHFWEMLGSAEWFLRLPSLLAGVLTIYFLYLIGKSLVNKNFGLFSAFLLAVSPFHIYFSQELRMYSTSAMFSTISMYFFLRTIKEKRNIFWILFTIFSILNIYTLYFAFFVLAAQFIYLLLVKEKLKKFILFGLISAGSFIFWIPQFLVQLKGGTWLVNALPGWQNAVSVPVLKALPEVFVKFFIGQISFQNLYLYGTIVLGLAVIFVFLTFKAFKNAQKNSFLFFLFWLVVPILLAFIISFFVPVISPKRLILSLPAFYSLLALGIVSFEGKKRIILLSLVTFISLICLTIYYVNPQFQREDWRSAVSFVEANGNSQSLSLFEFTDPFAPYLWYETGKVQASRAYNGILANNELVDSSMPYVTENANKIFLFQYLTDLTDPNHLVPNWLEGRGWKLKEVKDFTGVGFISTYERF